MTRTAFLIPSIFNEINLPTKDPVKQFNKITEKKNNSFYKDPNFMNYLSETVYNSDMAIPSSPNDTITNAINTSTNIANTVISSSLPKHKKVRFTEDQDNLIKNLVELNPDVKWKEIAERIPGKTAKQCRERYQHFLSPNIIREPWTVEDDARLIHSHHFLGTDWAKIAKFFPGRTNNDVKNRYNGHLKNKEIDVFLEVMKKI